MPHLFGLDIGSDAVKAAMVERTLRSRRVLKLARRAAGDDPDAAAQRLLADLGYDPDEDTLVTLYPGDRLTARRVTLPMTQRRKILEALPYELETLTPFEAETLVVDYLPMGEEGGGDVAAVATLRPAFEATLARLTGAGLSPEAMVPAVAVALTMADADAEAGVVIADADGASFTHVSHGRFVGFHYADLPSPAGDDEGYVGRLILGLKRLLAGAGGLRTMTQLVVCGVGATPERIGALTDRLGLPVTVPAFEGENALVDDELDGGIDRALYAPALAVALAATGDAPTLMNFRHGRYEKKRRFGGGRTQGTVAAGLAAFAVLLGLIGYVAEGVRLDAELTRLKTAVRSEFLRAMPKATTIVSERQQLTAELARLREKMTAMGGGMGGNDPLLERLYDISAALPKEITVDVEEMVYEPAAMTLAGRTVSFEQVESFKRALERIPWTTSVKVADAKTRQTGDGGVSFRIDMEIGG